MKWWTNIFYFLCLFLYLKFLIWNLLKSFKKSWLLSKTDEHKWTIVHIFHSLTPPPHKHSCVQNCAHTAQAPTRSILSFLTQLDIMSEFQLFPFWYTSIKNTGQIPVIVNVAFASRQSLNCTASFFSQITTQIRLN